MKGAEFLSGITMATFASASIFFLKFWKSSHDRFYLLFFIACCCLALERVALILVPEAQQSIRSALTEASSWVYLLRLAAFGVILVAIIDKNRKGSG